MTIKRTVLFEDLPNELLIEIFQSIDARNLFESFSNLNRRFNALLRSLNKLIFIIRPGQEQHENIDHAQIETLIVHSNANLKLSSYPRLRHLILIDSKDKQISEAMKDARSVEKIALISPRCFYTTLNFHEMIFSNGFPRLKSCHLTSVYLPSMEIRQVSWKQSPSIRSLKISSRDPSIHLAVLSACPNLRYFDLTIRQLDHPLVEIDTHFHLRKLRLRFEDGQWPIDQSIFKKFFIVIPYITDLYVHRFACLPELFNELIEFNWLGPIIHQQLQHLQRFYFYVHLVSTDENRYAFLIDQMQTNFRQIYSDLSHCILRIVRQ